MTKSPFALLTVFLLVLPGPALAYIGPGMGAGAIAAVFGVIGSIFLALFAILYYPIKRAIRRRKEASAEKDRTQADAE